MVAINRFYSDEEKLKYYASIARCDLNKYHNVLELRVYEGAEFLLYHWEEGMEVESENLIFDTLLLCTDFVASEKGIRATIVDRTHGKVVRVGELPNRILGYDVVSHTPYTCKVERTIKQTGRNRKIQGLNGHVSFRTRSNPADKIGGHTQIIPWVMARRHFGQTQFDLALARLEAGNG